MKSALTLTGLILILCSILSTKACGQQDEEYFYPYSEGTVVSDHKKGFMNYSMTTNKFDKIKLTASFYDSLGNFLYNHSFKLPELVFQGVVYNGDRGIFLFEDKNNFSLYNIFFEEHGKFYRFEQKKIKTSMKPTKVVMYNMESIYVRSITKVGFTLSKLNYNSEVLWTTELGDQKKQASLTDIFNSGNSNYLKINRNRYVKINDRDGNKIFDKTLTEESDVRHSFAHSYDSETKDLLIAGEEFLKKNLNSDASRYFYTQIDSSGNILQNRSFPIPSLKGSNSKNYRELRNEAKVMLIRDIFKVKDKFHLVGETVTRANIGLTGEKAGAAAFGIISGIVLGAVLMPHQAATLFVGVDNAVLTPSVNYDSLELKYLDKKPVAKLIQVDSGPIEHSNHLGLNNLGLFDYKFKLKSATGVYELIYLYSKTDSGLQLAKATISSSANPVITFFEMEENMKEATGYGVFKYSETSLLIQIKFEKGMKFKIVEIVQFR